jgi:hypothetical protein
LPVIQDSIGKWALCKPYLDKHNGRRFRESNFSQLLEVPMSPSTIIFVLFVLLVLLFSTQTYSLKSWFFSGSLLDNDPGESKLRKNPEFGKKLMANPLDAR